MDRRSLGLGVWAAALGVSVVAGGFIAAGRPEWHLSAAPFLGQWSIGAGPALAVAVGMAAAVVARGPALAARLAWGPLLAAVFAAAAAFTVALAATRGWSELTRPLTTRYDYLAGVDDIAEAGGAVDYLRTFVRDLRSFPTHVRAHPPGMVVLLWGTGAGPGATAALVIAGWAAGLVAVLVAVREAVSETAARHIAPYLVLLPCAVWAGTSADALFAGVTAWGVALLVLSTRPGRAWMAFAGGLVFAAALLLNYGVALLALVPALVAWRRGRFRVMWLSAAAVLAAFAALGATTGFWWHEGLEATRDNYDRGIASVRPLWFFVWANVGVVAAAVGPAVAVGVARLRERSAWLIVGGALAAMAVADVSGYSKGEVERIWLPFFPWAAVAAAADNRLLAVQAGWTLLLQLVLHSAW